MYIYVYKYQYIPIAQHPQLPRPSSPGWAPSSDVPSAAGAAEATNPPGQPWRKQRDAGGL